MLFSAIFFCLLSFLLFFPANFQKYKFVLYQKLMHGFDIETKSKYYERFSSSASYVYAQSLDIAYFLGLTLWFNVLKIVRLLWF